MTAPTFEDVLLTNADGSPRTLGDIVVENAVRDGDKIASVLPDHQAALDAVFEARDEEARSSVRAAAAPGFKVGSIGVDFSWAKPAPGELAGHDFVMLYLPYPGDGGKSASRAQVQSYLAAGKVVIALWEVAAGDCLRGYNVGLAHGQQARQSAYDNWGLPVPGSVIIPACDTDTTYAAVKPYLDGFDVGIQGFYRLGAYGGVKVTDPAVAAGTIGFQTIAWSYGVVGKGHVLQNGFNYYPNGTAANCDKDVITRTPVGGWGESGIIPQGGLLMSLTDAQQGELYGWLKQLHDQLIGPIQTGTVNVADEIRAALGTAQGLYNNLNALKADLDGREAKIQASEDALTAKVDNITNVLAQIQLNSGNVPSDPIVLQKAIAAVVNGTKLVAPTP